MGARERTEVTAKQRRNRGARSPGPRPGSRPLSPHLLPRPYALSSGFTFVEMVIALALIGLITLMLFSGLRLGTRAWEGVENIAEQTAEPRIARSFLARALAQVRPAQITFDGEQLLVFGGDEENLEFVAPLSEHVGTSGLYILRLSLQQDEVTRLVLTRWLLHADVLEGFGDVPEWEPFEGGSAFSDTGPLDEDLAAGAFGTTLLLDDVDEMEIGYFGILDGDTDPDWHSEWIGQSRMPIAVRMHLTTRTRAWPDMLLHLSSFDPSATGGNP